MTIAEDVPDPSYEQALSYPFDTLVAGHLTRLGTRHDGVTQIEFVKDVKSSAINATNRYANFTNVAQLISDTMMT